MLKKSLIDRAYRESRARSSRRGARVRRARLTLVTSIEVCPSEKGLEVTVQKLQWRVTTLVLLFSRGSFLLRIEFPLPSSRTPVKLFDVTCNFPCIPRLFYPDTLGARARARPCCRRSLERRVDERRISIRVRAKKAKELSFGAAETFR